MSDKHLQNLYKHLARRVPKFSWLAADEIVLLLHFDELRVAFDKLIPLTIVFANAVQSLLTNDIW